MVHCITNTILGTVRTMSNHIYHRFLPSTRYITSFVVRNALHYECFPRDGWSLYDSFGSSLFKLEQLLINWLWLLKTHSFQQCYKLKYDFFFVQWFSKHLHWLPRNDPEKPTTSSAFNLSLSLGSYDTYCTREHFTARQSWYSGWVWSIAKSRWLQCIVN